MAYNTSALFDYTEHIYINKAFKCGPREGRGGIGREGERGGGGGGNMLVTCFLKVSWLASPRSKIDSECVGRACNKCLQTH